PSQAGSEDELNPTVTAASASKPLSNTETFKNTISENCTQLLYFLIDKLFPPRVRLHVQDFC
ncbi:MAG: hypothetical protein ACK56F_25255, partial [bacterium]